MRSCCCTVNTLLRVSGVGVRDAVGLCVVLVCVAMVVGCDVGLGYSVSARCVWRGWLCRFCVVAG